MENFESIVVNLPFEGAFVLADPDDDFDERVEIDESGEFVYPDEDNMAGENESDEESYPGFFGPNVNLLPMVSAASFMPTEGAFHNVFPSFFHPIIQMDHMKEYTDEVCDSGDDLQDMEQPESKNSKGMSVSMMEVVGKMKARLFTMLGPNSLFLTTRVFAPEEADVDVSIVVDKTLCSPSQEVVDFIQSVFENCGYLTSVNYVSGDYMVPCMPFEFPSLMIEINRRNIYDEEHNLPQEGYVSINTLIKLVYYNLLRPELRGELKKPVDYSEYIMEGECALEREVFDKIGDCKLPMRLKKVLMPEMHRILSTYGKDGFLMAGSLKYREVLDLIAKHNLRHIALVRKPMGKKRNRFLIFADNSHEDGVATISSLREIFKEHLDDIDLHATYIVPIKQHQ